MNPISVAIKGKGLLSSMRRGTQIASRYGTTPGKMNRAMAQLAGLLADFGCGATIPITATALQRNLRAIEKYQAQGLEFAIHGYRHIDYSRLSQAEQVTQLELAWRAFSAAGLQPQGFRCPYLRWNPDTLSALRFQGLAYDSSQAIAWHIPGRCDTPAYLKAIDFYGAVSAASQPSLPSWDNGLVRIPYSLPDDEALVERLNLKGAGQMSALWLAILERSYELSELFALGVHPERIACCREPLMSVLTRARSFAPAVWIARLGEIAAWWKSRTEAVVKIIDVAPGQLHLDVTGPPGTTVLARNVQLDAPTTAWAEDYRRVAKTSFTLCASLRPVIGLSPAAAPELATFLQQQGYIVEVSQEKYHYAHYFDQLEFTVAHQRSLLDQIENDGHPLVRLGRWPDGCRSALAITGDVDALTLWDYGLRFLGR